MGRVLAGVAGLILLFGAAAAAAEVPAPVPPEKFFQQRALLEGKLSPSGARVAWTMRRGGGRVGLAVAELGAAAAGRVVAHSDDADIVDFDWVGDDRLVFSVSDLQAGSGEDQRAAPGLFAIDADGQAFRRLVQRGQRAFVTDVERRDDALEWNHELLHVPLPQQGVGRDEIVIGEMDFDGHRLRAITPMWLNTRSGRTRAMDLAGAPEHVVRWMFDSKGEPRLAVSQTNGRRAIHWKAPGDSRWRLLADDPLLQQRFTPRAVGDDGTLFVTHPEGAQGWSVLAAFDFDALAPAQPALLQTPGFDFDGHLLLEQPGLRAQGVRVHTDAETTVWFDAAMKRFQASTDARLPGRVNRIQCRRCGAPDMVALVFSYTDRDPGQLLIYQAATQRWERLGGVLDGIDPARMARVDLQRIKARDGRDLPVWLTLPAGVVPGKPAPAVVLVHGGPWTRGGYWRWEPMEQFLASRGYLVISPEFRGSTGYGEAHFRAGLKQWGRSMQDDVADALLWAQAQGLADRRACIAGASYGGYASLMGLVRHPALYRCGIAWVAVTDPFLYLTGSWWTGDDISADARRYQLPELVGDAVEDAAALAAVSPLAQAQHIRAPLLLAFGASDLRVPLAHGERLRAALEKAGRPPEWVSYDNEAHGWRQVSTQVDFARRVERFLQRHLGPSPSDAAPEPVNRP